MFTDYPNRYVFDYSIGISSNARNITTTVSDDPARPSNGPPYPRRERLFLAGNSLVQSRERRARLTLADIGQRKRRAVIARAAAGSHGGGGGGAAGVGGGNHGAKSPGRSLIGRVVQALTLRRSDRHSAQQAAEVSI